MKICPQCGDHYRDRTDFCFNDGAVLRPPSAGEMVSVVTEARASASSRPPPGPRRGAPPPADTPNRAVSLAELDPATVALIAQVEAAVTTSVVEVRRAWFRELESRRRAALARLSARMGVSAFGLGMGCMTMLVVVAPIIVGAALWVGRVASPDRAAAGFP